MRPNVDRKLMYTHSPPFLSSFILITQSAVVEAPSVIVSANSSAPNLRALLLGGDFFLGGVIAGTLAKISLKMQAALQPGWWRWEGEGAGQLRVWSLKLVYLLRPCTHSRRAPTHHHAPCLHLFQNRAQHRLLSSTLQPYLTLACVAGLLNTVF